MVISITSHSKSAKKAENPFAANRAILEPLDIKCVDEYLYQYTTHLISAKRNTSAVLQALVNGHHIVNQQFIDSLAIVGKKEKPTDQSKLEIDFEANWPRELDYLPNSGKEPNPRPANSPQFTPDPARAEVFSKYTFIFNDQAQYDTLMPTITGGGGKALVRQLQPGETDISDMLEYVREVAGKKGDPSFDLTQQTNKTVPGGIILLRHGGHKNQMPGYYVKLDSVLGQRSIEQNELLDAILDTDASKLKREVPAEERQKALASEGECNCAFNNASLHEIAAPAAPADHVEQPRERRQNPLQRATEDTSMAERERQSPAQEEAVPSQKSAAPEPSTDTISRRRAARQRTTQPRYRGFDDFEPETTISKYEPPSPSQTPAPEGDPSQAPSVDPMEAEYPDEGPSQRFATQRTQTQQSARKRRGEPLEENRETTSNVVDGILKGAATMKRRKIEEQKLQKAAAPQNVEDDEDMDQGQDEEPAAPVKKVPRRRKEKEIDVRAAVNERRAAEDEARQRDEENLRAAFDGMDVADIRNLAQVEEMDILRKDPPPRTRYTDEGDAPSDRWDDKWNGRKNFKKFRRQVPRHAGGEDGGGGASYERQRMRVIVALEEVQKKPDGEDYWLESVEDSGRKMIGRKGKTKKRGAPSQRFSAGSPSVGVSTPTSTRPSQSQTLRASAPATRQEPEVIASDSDSNNEEDTTNRFRRRIRNSRIQDEEAAHEDEIFPDEIAGTARDEALNTAAHSHANQSIRTTTSKSSRGARRGSTVSIQPDTPEISTRGTQKRRAADQGGSAPKRARASRTPVEPEEEESDEEDSLKFRRRRR